MKIVPIDALVHSLPTNIIRRAVGKTPFQTRSCHPDRKSVLIVVPALSDLVSGRLRERCAAKFGGEQNERVVEESALP